MLWRRCKSLLDAAIGASAVGLIRAVRWFDRKRTANLVAAIARTIGPLLKENRLGRRQLRAAFPEKSGAEIEKILSGVWDNLGRVVVEFAHLDQLGLKDFGPQNLELMDYAPEARQRAERLMAGNKASLCFTAHLANWELSGVAVGRTGVKSAILFRRPNIEAISDAVIKLRQPLMGELIPTSLDAPVKLARLLEAGVHVGMLADQHYVKGVEVIFFGRRCRANPLIAMLARQTESPIHGIRVVRQRDRNSFWLDITDPIEVPRDPDGRIAIAGTMQTITSIIEDWVREYPDQWLWLHKRWR